MQQDSSTHPDAPAPGASWADSPEAHASAISAMRPAFGERIVRWQKRHGRHGLPWQGTRDAYRIWLSEVMLQQTQVTTVLAYYERFLARWPDVRALAAASLDDVMGQWSGLGYYSRARLLHRCAQQVVEQHGGRFPRRAAELVTLPGIGRSTAAAIAAFSAGERVAILDGNVKRVLARVLAFGDDLAQPAALARLWTLAETLLPAAGMRAYTQGLMDLGAGPCGRTARCEACPVAALCRAHAAGHTDVYPLKSRLKRRGRREHALLCLWDGSRVWLVRRPARGIWAGLHSLPEWPAAEALAQLVAGWPGTGEALVPVDHALTHLDLRLLPLRWRLPPALGAEDRRRIESLLPPGRWVEADELETLGLPTPVRRLLTR